MLPMVFFCLGRRRDEGVIDVRHDPRLSDSPTPLFDVGGGDAVHEDPAVRAVLDVGHGRESSSSLTTNVRR